MSLSGLGIRNNHNRLLWGLVFSLNVMILPAGGWAEYQE